jgi:hypothetical protein
MKKLVEVMARWRVLLGVTTEPTDTELIVICQFVYDNFKNYTLEDIKLAMNWAISGKTEVGFVTQKTISSYYVSRALNAYDALKRQLYNKLMEERSNHLRKLEADTKAEFTPEQKAENFKSLILELFDSYQKGGFFIDYGDMVYNWLKKTRIITITNELVNEAVKYGKDQFLEERKKEAEKRILKAIEPSSRDYREKKLARHYIVLHFFKNTDLQQIIKSIKPEQFQ